MKSKHKLLNFCLILLVFMLVGLSTNAVLAAPNVSVSGGGGRYTGTGSGNNTNHSGYVFVVDGQRAYCAQAGVAIGSGTYVKINPISDTPAFSYIMDQPWDEDLKQAVIWQFAGGVAGSGSYVQNPDQAFNDAIGMVNAHASDVHGGSSASISGAGDFVYDRSRNAYVSPYMNFGGTSSVSFTNAPASAFFENTAGQNVGQNVGDGTFRIVVPAQHVTSDLDVGVTANAASGGWKYGPADCYTDGPGQILLVGTKVPAPGAPATASLHLTAVGDLRIAKYDEHGKLVVGAQFRITGHGIDEIIVTGQPSAKYGNDAEDGIAKLLEIRIGEYNVTEVGVPGNLFISSNLQNVNYHTYSGYTLTVTFRADNDYKRGEAQLDKFDMDYIKNLKGDCVLNGAEYAIFADEDIKEGFPGKETLLFAKDEQIGIMQSGQLKQVVLTDANGKTPVVRHVYSTIQGKELDGLPIGHYYWKEIKPSEGFNLNPDVVRFEILDNGTSRYVEDVGKVDATQGEKLITGRGRVIKYDNDNHNDENKNDTDKSAAEGAVLQLQLVSAKGTDQEARNTYTATIDANGHCEFIDPEYRALHPDDPYTIPYGTYELTELQASNNGTHTYYYIQTEIVIIDENHEIESRIVADEPVPMYIKLIKKDKETGEEVHIAGGKYKIWDCQDNEFVTQITYPTGNYIDVFETNDKGYLYTPHKLFAGEYIIYEIEAPKGYYLDNEYRLPEDSKDYGDETKGGIKVHIDKQALEILEETQAPLVGEPDLVYPVVVANSPLKGKIEIFKTGEMLTEQTISTTKVNGQYYEVTTPKYEQKGLDNVTFDVFANEDIYSPDGRIKIHNKGDKVDTITTADNGYAVTKELWPGEYRLEEVETPLGFVKLENIPAVTVTSEDPLVRVNTIQEEYENDKQHTKIKVKKDLDDVKYKINDEKINVVLGLYSNQDIKNYNSTKTVISKDTLLDVLYAQLEIGEEVELESTVDLPAGQYCVKELYVDYPYTREDEKFELTVSHNNTTDATVEIKGPSITNHSENLDELAIVKLSSTLFVENVKENLVGGLLSKEQQDKCETELFDWINRNDFEKVKRVLTGNATEEDIEDEFVSKNMQLFKKYTLTGAEYTFYLDKECTKPLRYSKDDSIVKIVTDDQGFASIDELPLGKYYLKETVAPTFVYGEKTINYDLSEEPIEVHLTKELKGQKVCRACFDDLTENNEKIIKTDLFTGELVPDCKFEIRDEEGEEVISGTTDSEGKYEIKLDLFEEGKTYTYTEIDAPDIYDIDTTPHEITIEFDENGKIIPIEVHNIRKTRQVIVRKTDRDTGDPLQGCVFTIALIDPVTKEQKVHEVTGEPIYLVQNAVTDENGEYVIDEAPMGTYKFIEITPPEGYELDEDISGLEFTIDNDSAETIIFEVTNTGDIAVVLLVVVAIVCVAGIAFVVIRNKKKSAK